MAVSKKDSQSSPSSDSPSPSNNNSNSNGDSSDSSSNSEDNDSNSKSNGSPPSQRSSDGQSDQSNSNNNSNSGSSNDQKSNNGQEANSNSSGNSNGNSPPPDSKNGNNKNNSPPSSNEGNDNNSPPNSSNGNSNDNSPPNSDNGNNDNNSPPNSNSNSNSNNGNNNNSPSNSNSHNGNSNNNPRSQQDNNRPSQSNNSPSPPSPPRNSGRPMFTPPPHALNGGNSPASKSSNGLNSGVIAGVVIGGGVLLILIVILCVCLCKRKKKKDKRFDSMKYFPDDQNAQQYYNNNNTGWHGNKQEMMGNNYSGATAMSSQQHWGPAMPPPLPPNMMSSEMASTGQYSSGPAGPVMPPPPPPSLGFNKSTFTYDELAAATNGFSQANLIGQGGFGFVHKGVLPNGKEIAVKSLKSGSGQGEREFQAEVEIISRVHHRHLVSLVGYCIAGGQRMLVYEFIPNKTLEYHLYGKDRPVMDFPTRMKIALGSAKGLAYLHEDCHPRIIHRDIKGANILIDNSFDAKVADFGLAKLSNDNHTHVSTRIMGTFGYLAPEYAASGKLTEKSDVFSFGVMLLELVTGKRPIDPNADEEDCLVDWAKPLIPRALEEGVFDGLVDPRLEGQFDPQEMTRLIACAGAATRQSGKRRPKMSQIVRALEGDMSLDSLNEPVKTGAMNHGGSFDYDSAAYNNDMNKFRRAVLDSTEYSSSSTDSSGVSKTVS